MKDYMCLIDTQTPGPRCDVTPVFADPAAFAQLVADLADPFRSTPIDYVAGIDALGFILGTAIALHLRKGFLPIRKAGKLPVAATTAQFVDYTGQTKSLELRKVSVRKAESVLIVDEWIETGAQMQAAIDLIENAGGIVAGIVTINMDTNPLSVRLREKYKCQAVWFDMQETDR
ncbi:MAG: adenine phosphoribosyltransferase [candidate division Zixibacteria bacterium]|nr:adenine phosphoribosyltransferase [candidate division Zixibacteria bacterium]